MLSHWTVESGERLVAGLSEIEMIGIVFLFKTHQDTVNSFHPLVA